MFWSCSSCPLCNKVGQIIQGGEILSKKKGSFILLESEGNFITDWGSYTLKQRKYYAKSAWPFGKIKISQTNKFSEPITVSIRLQTPLECVMFVISLRYGLCFLVHFDCKSIKDKDFIVQVKVCCRNCHCWKIFDSLNFPYAIKIYFHEI